MKTQHVLIVSGCIVISGAIIYNYIQRKRITPPVYYKNKLIKNYNARTIPPFGIFIKESERNNDELLQHELIHWKQYQEKGLINFYHHYITELKKHGYDNMPMEKEARINESEYCQDNYTECVRSGEAQTIYNPNFRT